MKITPANINFKGIYKYNLDCTKQPYETIMFQNMIEGNFKDKQVIAQHRLAPVFVNMLNEYLNAEPKTNKAWFFSHAKLHGVDVPKYLTEEKYDMFIFTDKDAKLCKKFKDKINKKIIKLHRALKNNVPKDKTGAQTLMEIISKFDKEEQIEFEKFLKDKDIGTLEIKIAFANKK